MGSANCRQPMSSPMHLGHCPKLAFLHPMSMTPGGPPEDGGVCISFQPERYEQCPSSTGGRGVPWKNWSIRSSSGRTGPPLIRTGRPAWSTSTRPGRGWACGYPLSDKPLVVGRGEDCDIRIQDTSVCRRHARIEQTRTATTSSTCRAPTAPSSTTSVARRRPDPAAGRRLPAGRQLHLPLPGRRQRRGRVPRGDLPADDHRRPDPDPQRPVLHRVPRPRGLRHGPARPAAVAGPVRHRPVQDDQRRPRPPGRATSRCASWPRASRRWSARKTCSPATAARSSPWCCSRPACRTRCRWPSGSGAGGEAPVPVRGQGVPPDDQPGRRRVPADGTATPRELIRQADEKLYAAKRAGRNKVVG